MRVARDSLAQLGFQQIAQKESKKLYLLKSMGWINTSWAGNIYFAHPVAAVHKAFL
jgi:hypothetical protein